MATAAALRRRLMGARVGALAGSGAEIHERAERRMRDVEK
jgi:hypothetical protein